MKLAKVKKGILVFILVFGGGLIIPVGISLIVNGANRLYASNFVFAAGLLAAAVGCGGLIVPFSMLKSKIRKLKIGEELVTEKKDRLMWEYIWLAAGAALLFASYAIALF